MSTLGKEIALLRYGVWGWFERDPLPDLRKSFTCYKESGWKNFLFAILLLIGFESLAIQAFLFSHRWFAYTHLFLGLYGVVWLLGDYQAIKKNLVTINSTVLHVRMGLRWDFIIPFENIGTAELGMPKEFDAPLEVKMNQFITKKRIEGYEFVTVAGKPNLYLTLKTPITIFGPLGRQKTMSRIGLGIDEPEVFVGRVLNYITKS